MFCGLYTTCSEGKTLNLYQSWPTLSLPRVLQLLLFKLIGPALTWTALDYFRRASIKLLQPSHAMWIFLKSELIHFQPWFEIRFYFCFFALVCKHFVDLCKVLCPFEIGLYQIWLFQIWPEPNLAGFRNSNPAGAESGVGENPFFQIAEQYVWWN